jgi:DNA-binding beta-propeller fold protein YncE
LNYEVTAMNKSASICIAALLSFFSVISRAEAQTKEALHLAQTIPLPNVKGRFDHIDVDVEGKRLFVAGVESGSVEVVDLGTGKWMRSISGFKTPTEMCYVRELNKMFVASRDDGMIRVFRGESLELIDSLKLELGVNRIVYDPASKYLYAGYGGPLAGFDYGRVGIIDARSDKLLGDIAVEAHPSQILLDNAAHRILVAVWERGRIDVFDTRNHQLVLTWTTGGQSGDTALDQTHHRLFTATRTPPQTMVVYDSESGQEVARLPAEGRMNGVYYDGWHKRIYVTCGRDLPAGFVFVYQQKDADHYEFIGKVPTGPGAGTSFWVPQLNRFYVPVPASEKQPAAVLVFEPEP